MEAILDATERLVVQRGVEALSTRDIAEEAAVPVASLYQYFADKEGVLLALAERHMSEMDEQTAADLAQLETLTIATVVETAMRSFVTVYLRRPAFVEIYLRGRTNPALHAYGRDHNARVARALRDFGLEAGLVTGDLSVRSATLAVEVGDRVFQLAFEHDAHGDEETIAEGIAMMTAHLARYATSPAAIGEPVGAAR